MTYITRSGWDAKSPRNQYDHHKPIRVILHHSGTEFHGPRTIRAIQNYHQNNNGWNDIGYHFLISPDGDIYEGRPTGVIGAHCGGHNAGSIGICLVGNYSASEVPIRSLQSLDALLDMLEQAHGILPDEVHPHSEFKNTECPGKELKKYIHNRRCFNGIN